MERDQNLKRISLFITEEQYVKINEKGLNLSWLIRDLLDDYLQQNKINLTVGKETNELYRKVVQGDATDSDFEPFFRDAIQEYLKSKIENLKKLEKTSFKKGSNT